MWYICFRFLNLVLEICTRDRMCEKARWEVFMPCGIFIGSIRLWSRRQKKWIFFRWCRMG